MRKHNKRKQEEKQKQWPNKNKGYELPYNYKL